MRVRPKDLAAVDVIHGHRSNRVIGWTYEADQEAIKEAKDEIEDLETDKLQEDLQYQIDQLEAQKALLEAIPSSAELQETKETYEDWVEKITEAGETQADILASMKEIYDNIGQITQDMKTWVNAESKSGSSNYTAYSQIGSLMSDIESGYAEQASLASSGSAGTTQYAQSVAQTNEDLSSLSTLFAQAGIDLNDDTYKDTSLTKDEIIAKTGNTALSIYTDDEWADLQNMYNQYLANLSSGTWGEQDIPDAVLNMSKGITVTSGSSGYSFPSQDYALAYDYDDTGETLDNNTTEKIFEEGGGSTSKTKFFGYDPSSKKWSLVATGSDYKDDRQEVTDDLTGLSAGAIIAAGKTDYNTSDMSFWYKINSSTVTPMTYGAQVEGVGEAYAEGTLDALGGVSLINEEGLEGIITPQGTLTSLPAHSGVVPADLTKNLFILGEIAPNLIKELDSLSSDYGNTEAMVSSDDHSTNISNLYATFQADDNFDFDKFLADVRSAINLNRHISG